MSVTTLGPASLRGVWIYGEAGYVNRSVYQGLGQRFLTPATRDFLHMRGPVGAVTQIEAEAVAENVVKAACRMAEIDPPASGIGGPVRTVVMVNAPQDQEPSTY